MSAPKFTPGPWCVGVPMNGETYSPDKVFDVFGESVAMVYGMAINTPLSEQPERSRASIANAHLIAAAPELYAALQLALGALESAHEDDEFGFDAEITAARAALAKARGEG